MFPRLQILQRFQVFDTRCSTICTFYLYPFLMHLVVKCSRTNIKCLQISQLAGLTV